MNHTIQNHIDTAIVKARAVERSHSKHHQALLALIIAAYALEDDTAMFDALSSYYMNRVAEAPDTVCTKATGLWFNEHFGLRVQEDGRLSRGRDWDRKGVNEKTLEEGKKRPWYKIASDKIVKPWSNPMESVMRQMSIGWLTGDITREEMAETFNDSTIQAIVLDAINTPKLQDKAVKILNATIR